MIPEGIYPVSMTRPVTTNGGFTTDYVSVKNAQMAWIVVHLAQTVGHATLFTPVRATAVAPTGSAVLANVVPIFYGNVSTSTNALADVTAALNYTIDVGVTGDVYIIFKIDPANLGTTYDCIGLTIANSGQATNFADVTCWIQPRYASQVSHHPSYIVD